MSVYETSITNPKKQLEFYKDLSKQLEQENQELKQKINTYENPNDLTLMFMYCNEKARDMIEELKKQLEEMDSKLFFTKYELDMRQKSIDNKLNQQKEFIEYLENYIDALKQQKETVEGLDIGEEHILMVLEEVLEKYKGIIGGSNENNSI